MEESRKQFEEWFEKEYKHLESSKYTDFVPHIKYGFWMAWQSSRADIEVNLSDMHLLLCDQNDVVSELNKHGIKAKVNK